jgi:hypothetical protein
MSDQGPSGTVDVAEMSDDRPPRSTNIAKMKEQEPHKEKLTIGGDVESIDKNFLGNRINTKQVTVKNINEKVEDVFNTTRTMGLTSDEKLQNFNTLHNILMRKYDRLNDTYKDYLVDNVFTDLPPQAEEEMRQTVHNLNAIERHIKYEIGIKKVGNIVDKEKEKTPTTSPTKSSTKSPTKKSKNSPKDTVTSS